MIDKIKYHKDKRKYFKVQRQVATEVFEKSNGYIVDFSEDFIVLQETDDFEFNGYVVFPITTIAEIQFNNKDKYYDKIMRLEGLTDKVENKYKIDLTNWTSIFKSIKAYDLNVVIENEDPNDKSFDIGPITKVTKTSVYILYFDSQGYFDEEPTKISFDLITRVKFDERYTNVMSKYLKERKSGIKK